MWSKLEEVFNEIGVEYLRQGSLASVDDYPQSGFFTFWNANTPQEGFYDNRSNCRVWHWQVCYYTNDPSTLYSMMDRFEDVAESHGFEIDELGKDIGSDRPDYLGRVIRIKYLEMN